MPTTSPWIALARAAKYLDVTHEALKKRCQRTAKRTRGGVVESVLAPGIVARKLGRDWVVRLSEGWGPAENDH